MRTVQKDINDERRVVAEPFSFGSTQSFFYKTILI